MPFEISKKKNKINKNNTQFHVNFTQIQLFKKLRLKLNKYHLPKLLAPERGIGLNYLVNLIKT